MTTKPLPDLPATLRPSSKRGSGSQVGNATITLRRPAWLPGVELWTVNRFARPWSFFYATYTFITAAVLDGPYEWMCRQGRHQLDTTSLMVAEPGDLQVRLEPTYAADLRCLVVAPEVVEAALGGQDRLLPRSSAQRRFSSPQVSDPGLCAHFSRLWRSIERVADQTTMRPGSASTWPGAPPPRTRPKTAEASAETAVEQQHLLRAFIRASFEGATGTALPATTRPRDRAVARVCAILEGEYRNRISLDRLSAETGFSKYYLERTFHEQIGVPVHQYLKKVRVAMALDCLRKGQRPSVVATKTGFSDQPHLTRVFREELGFTPRTYWAALTAMAGQA